MSVQSTPWEEHPEKVVVLFFGRLLLAAVGWEGGRVKLFSRGVGESDCDSGLIVIGAKSDCD